MCHPLYADSKKKLYKWTYLQNKNRLIDLENEFVIARPERGRIGGTDS